MASAIDLNSREIMKTAFILILAAGQLMAADPVSEALQKALFEEEANHNLDAAIKAYQSVIDQTAEQRKFTATAVFRLGECYRKLNKTNEAIAQYQRLIREFSDAAALVNLSQQNLNALGTNVPRASGLAAATSAEAEEIEKIKAMIQYSPDLINAPNESGITPLSRAALSGYLVVARFLLDNKAEVNGRDNDGTTPIHRAADAGHKAMVELLLERGADVNARDKKQNQPLHLATVKGYRSVVELLVSRKADVKGEGELGQTPLYLAARYGHGAIAGFLLDHGAELSAGSGDGRTPLHIACREGNVELITLLLERGADVNAQDNRGWSALHHAVFRSPDVIKLLLRYKPDTELKTRDVPGGNGYTPLMTAAANPGVPIESLELLLQAGADPNKSAVTTPLMAAVQAVHPEKVQLLLQHKAEPDRAVKDWTPLAWTLHTPGRNSTAQEKVKLAEIAELLRKHGAKDDLAMAKAAPQSAPGQVGVAVAAPPPRVMDMQDKEIERLQRLIKDSPDLINGRDSQNQTAMHRAAAAGQTKVINFLLTNRAEVNIRDKERWGSMPLHKAVMTGRKEIVELLLAKGADIHAVGSEEQDRGEELTLAYCQPLHMAVKKGNQAIVETLINAKADVNARDYRARTPLHFAVNQGFLGLARLLVSKGADVNPADELGRTPAMLAVDADYQNIFSFLLEQGIDVNAQNKDGQTLLHKAAYQRPPRIMQPILAKRPDLEIAAKDGATPLMNAVSAGNLESAQLLLEAGANPKVRTANGHFPLFIAGVRGNKPMVELLLKHKVDVNQRNSENQTTLANLVAKTPSAPPHEQKALREIAELLRKHGAKEEVSSAKTQP